MPVMRGCVVSTAFLAVACTSEAGLARIRFELDAPAELTAPARLVFSVVGPPDEGDRGTTSTTLALAPGPLVSMTAPAIELRYGAGQRARMEIEDALSGDVLFYGLSAPFALEPGATAEVVVPVRARPELRLVVDGTRDGRATDPRVRLRLFTDRGVRAAVSPAPLGPRRVSAQEERDLAASGAAAGHLLEWDLDSGLARGCVEQDVCPRAVHARVYDVDGYASVLASAMVEVDTRAPDLVPASTTVVVEPTSLLVAPTAARPGARVDISFLVSEPLVAVELLADGLVFGPCSATGSLYTCTTTVPLTGAAEGAVVVRARLEDRAGNRAVRELHGLIIDAQPPSPPRPEALLLERRPWDRSPTVRLVGEAGAVEPGARVVALDLQGARLGVSPPADDEGRFELDLPPRDVITVAAQAIDAAGLASAPSVVHRGRLVVAAGGVDAPVSVESVAQLGAAREGGMATSIGEASRARLAEGDGGASVTATLGVQWVVRPQRDVTPPARSDHGLLFDRGRGRWVMYGGAWLAGEHGDLWESDGTTWRERIDAAPPQACGAGVSGPGARRDHGFVYDAARRVSLLFGGYAGSGALGDTWTWDGTTWREVCPAKAPSPRAGAALAYDRARGTVVLFGGLVGGTASAETWSWDGTTWSGPLAAGPHARWGASLAWDPDLEEVVLVGGRDQQPVDDGVWSWTEGAWKKRAPAGASPARALATWVYSPAHRGMLLMGGAGEDGRLLDDAHVWTSTSGWRAVVGPLEPPRQSAAVAEADAAGHVLYSGGRDRADVRDALWSSEGLGWRSVGRELAWPAARARAASAIEASTGRWVVFGGSVGLGDLAHRDTWSWDGWSWTETASSGPPLLDAALAWDATAQALVLVGTQDMVSETTAWTLRGGSWQAAGMWPEPLDGVAAAYASAVGGVVISGSVGGGHSRYFQRVDDVISEWDTPNATTRLASLSSNAAGTVLLALGGVRGTRPVDELWIHRGGAWSQWMPSADPSPSPRSQHAAAFDALRGELLVDGGVTRDAAADTALWTFDPVASTWRSWPAGGGYVGASMAAMGEVVWSFAGGRTATDRTRELRRLARPADARPALRLTVAWDRAGVSRERIEGVEVTLGARGAGGVELLAWDAYAGAWASMRTAPVAASALVQLAAALPAERVLDGAGDVTLAVVPLERAGAGWAKTSVSLDHLEVRIVYGGEP